MQKITVLIVLTLTALVFSSAAISSVESLRGKAAIDADATKAMKHKLETVEGGIQRNFKKQPPLIPHKTEKYKVTLTNNGCLKCHSEKAYKKEKAPKVGDSHYVARDGKVLKTISGRRYFCEQCHVTQVQSGELVDNTYEGID